MDPWAFNDQSGVYFDPLAGPPQPPPPAPPPPPPPPPPADPATAQGAPVAALEQPAPPPPDPLAGPQSPPQRRRVGLVPDAQRRQPATPAAPAASAPPATPGVAAAAAPVAAAAGDPLAGPTPPAPAARRGYQINYDALGAEVTDLDRSIIGAERGATPGARNPNSSATGNGQFLDGTWLDMMARYGSRAGIPQALIQQATAGDADARRELLALRADPQLSERMTALYRTENQTRLGQAGLPTGPAETYLAHFLGPQGAIDFLRARAQNPAALADTAVSPSAIRANQYRNAQGQVTASPFMDITPNGQRMRTLDEVYQWAGRRMGAGGPQVAAAQQPAAAAGQPQPAVAGGARGADIAQQILAAGRTSPEERQSAQRNSIARAAMMLGLGILASSSRGSPTPRSAIGEGVAQGGVAALQQLQHDEDRQYQRERTRTADARGAITAAASLRPRPVSAGGRLYQTDPLTGETTQLADAGERFHQPVTMTAPDGTQTAIQAGDRGSTREIGPGSVARGTSGPGRQGAEQTTALIRNARFLVSVGAFPDEASAVADLRNRQNRPEADMRRDALNWVQREERNNARPFTPEQRQSAVQGYMETLRGNVEAAREHFGRAYGAAQAQQPSFTSRILRGIFNSGDATPTPDQAPAAAAGAAGSAPPPAPAAAPAASDQGFIGGALDILNPSRRSLREAERLQQQRGITQPTVTPPAGARTQLAPEDRARARQELAAAAARATPQQMEALRQRGAELGLTDEEIDQATAPRQPGY